MSGNGIQIRLGDVLHVVWKRRLLIIALTAAGLVLGIVLYGMGFLQGELGGEYTVTSSVAVVTRTTGGNFTSGYENPNKDDVYLAQDMVDTVIYTMTSDRAMEEVIQRVGLVGVTVRDLSGSLSAGQYGGSQIIELAVEWPNEEEGKSILQTLTAVTEEIMQQTLSIGRLETIDAPAVSSQRVGAVFGGTGVAVMCAVGFLVGVGIALLELLMRPTLLNLKDVENVFGLEKLAVVPRDSSLEKKKGPLLSQESGEGAASRKYYAAAAHILYNRLGRLDGCKCLYVTSAVAGEGRTTAAANLAIQLSDMGHKVLLLDLDTRNPNLGALFMERVDYNRSLNALYRGEATVEDAIITLTGYLDLMPAVLERNAIAIDSAVLEMVKRLSAHYEFIVMDAGPVSQSADVLSLNEVADTAVYVARYDYATIHAMEDALATLDKSGVRVLGCIVNDAQHVKGEGRQYRESRAGRRKQTEEDDFSRFIFEEETAPDDGHRSIMDENFSAAMDRGAGLSDDDAVEELLKMGFSGSWQTEKAPAAEAPGEKETSAPEDGGGGK